MSETYVDRGMVKWQPFDSLVGYRSMLGELKQTLGQKQKASLCDDAFDMLEYNLQQALAEGLEIEVHYHQSGYTRVTSGTIRRIDPLFKTMVLSTGERIKADDVLALMLP
ncbi:MAG: hypothetical protein EA375_03720 [Acholeplasmataceae bacterium]|nr:MAG: hypothetical protein EA375_03720 [Acholeplasmataceae bacterium]